VEGKDIDIILSTIPHFPRETEENIKQYVMVAGGGGGHAIA
jgi:hypothetical protein